MSTVSAKMHFKKCYTLDCKYVQPSRLKQKDLVNIIEARSNSLSVGSVTIKDAPVTCCWLRDSTWCNILICQFLRCKGFLLGRKNNPHTCDHTVLQTLCSHAFNLANLFSNIFSKLLSVSSALWTIFSILLISAQMS